MGCVNCVITAAAPVPPSSDPPGTRLYIEHTSLVSQLLLWVRFDSLLVAPRLAHLSH